MVKHHGLIIIDVAVWILRLNRILFPEPINIIGVAVWCLFLMYPLKDYQEFLKWRAYFQFSGTRTGRLNRLTGSKLSYSEKNVGIAVRFLVIHIASHKAINSHNQFQGTTKYNRLLLGVPL